MILPSSRSKWSNLSWMKLLDRSKSGVRSILCFLISIGDVGGLLGSNTTLEYSLLRRHRRGERGQKRPLCCAESITIFVEHFTFPIGIQIGTTQFNWHFDFIDVSLIKSFNWTSGGSWTTNSFYLMTNVTRPPIAKSDWILPSYLNVVATSAISESNSFTTQKAEHA